MGEINIFTFAETAYVNEVNFLPKLKEVAYLLS